MQRLPRSRSGLMLAAMRVLVALLLSLWLWVAPPHPALGGSATAYLFIGYLAFAVALLGVAWQSWWLEFHLARPAFVIDAATLLSGLFLTEAVTLDFFSPFLTFFAFLMLSSAARWSRRSMLMIVGGLVLGFLLAGWLIDWDGLPIDMARFTRRFSALALLSLMLVWFTFGRQLAGAIRFDRQMASHASGQLGGALDYAMAAYGAKGGVLAWLDEGESCPRLLGAGVFSDRLPSGRVTLDDEPRPFLFDRTRKRRIILTDGKHLSAQGSKEMPPLIDHFAPEQGLFIPIAGRHGRGQIILSGIAGMNSDDLFSAQGVAHEIAAGFDDDEMDKLAREVALSRLRTQIATDLHDSVIQTLAGARFRLQALKNGVEQQRNVAKDIDLICTGIAGEQDHVRSIIEQLRKGQIRPGSRDLHQELQSACGPLSRQWMVEIDLMPIAAPIIAPASFCFEVQQILREATANAVRHGAADRITVSLSAHGGRLLIDIVDNGRGFSTGKQPRTIAQRVAWLGGDLTIASAPGQTRIAINLPLDTVS